jgi:50S ribosomal subunit-associated GTPase HflX
VGYTNAGKSTLFNALVKARAYAADQLFATLDTTTASCTWATPRARSRCRTPSASSATCRTA